jgi:hypothetical protein
MEELEEKLKGIKISKKLKKKLMKDVEERQKIMGKRIVVQSVYNLI